MVALKTNRLTNKNPTYTVEIENRGWQDGSAGVATSHQDLLITEFSQCPGPRRVKRQTSAGFPLASRHGMNIHLSTKYMLKNKIV